MGRHKNFKQEAIMVYFMKKHRNFAFGHSDRQQRNALWIQFAKKLNEHGPPRKPAKCWKKVWFDWRAAVKRKVLSERNNTQGPEELQNLRIKKSLSPAEHEVALICGFYETTTLENADDNCDVDLQEDSSAQLSGGESYSGDGVLFDISKEDLNFTDDDNSLGFDMEDEVAEEEHDNTVDDTIQSNINVPPNAHYDDVAHANTMVKTELEDDYEANVSTTEKLKLNNTNPAAKENVETTELMQLVKQQAKVVNAVSMLINENTNLQQENLHILKDLRQGVKELCESIKQLNGATNDQLKEQRRHNYEMEKLRREEISLQKQQLQLNELKVFGNE